MGAWEELDTEVNVEIDTSDLDKVLDLADEYGIFDPVKEYCNNLKKAYEEGSQEGALDIARRNKSFQQQFIFKNCDNPSGMLASSIDYEQTGERSYLIGTRINHVYPMSIEYGHTDIYPVRAKALAFYYQGELIFRKHVRSTKPRPFVAPAYEVTSQIADEIVLRKINIAIDRY